LRKSNGSASDYLEETWGEHVESVNDYLDSIAIKLVEGVNQ